ncbi:MAG: YdcF family protein [Pseudomonadota bacterium]
MIGRLLRRVVRLAWNLVRLGAVVLAITVVAVLAAERAALQQYKPRHLEPVDIVIVLGGGIEGDYHLNIIGRARADLGANLIGWGRTERVIFTGIFGNGGRPEEFPRGEAGLMYDRAVASGADPARLIIEPKARTTLENLTLSFAIAEAEGAQRLAIATDAFHLPRAMVLARFLGAEDIQGVVSKKFSELGAFQRIGLLLREAMAWWYNLYKIAAWTALEAAGVPESERDRYVI